MFKFIKYNISNMYKMKYIKRCIISKILPKDSHIILHIYNESRNEIIPNNIIGLNIESCYEDNSFCSVLNRIPTSVIDLNTLNIHVCKNMDNLPLSIKYFTFDSQYNYLLDNLPHNIFTLYVGKNFNKQIDNLPLSLNKLVFSSVSQFRKRINKLPSNITLLTFTNIFNRQINYFPQKLSQLTLSSGFDANINNLPSMLLQLNCGDYFNKCINNLPHRLTQLYLCKDFKKYINNLSSIISYIDLNSNFFTYKINNLPNSISYMRINYLDIITNSKLPNSLTYITYDGEDEIKNIPETITRIEFGPSYYESLEHLHKKIKIIELPFYEDDICDLPKSIKEIWIPTNSIKLDIS